MSTGGVMSAGGVVGTGGSSVASTGGMPDSGGVPKLGGSIASGGSTGGVASTGGAVGSGGAAKSGGAMTTGGISGGATGTGGVTASGGAPKLGGTTAAGGSSGGTTGSGGTVGDAGTTAGLPAAADILTILKKVIPYEIQLGPEDSSWVNKWTEATFYIGVMAAYLATNESSFLTDATNWGTKNKWTLLASPTRSPDNQCAGQVYEDIYLANPVASNANMYANTKTNVDAMVANPKPGVATSDDWYWCDTLFMAPGVVSRLGKIAGDTKYFTFLDTMWSGTQTGLFDSKTGLFWRDQAHQKSDPTVYWSRGNGWVVGGIVRVLEYLPATDASHDAYVTLLKTMAAALKPLQQSDGTWHADLTHPTADKMSNPEVSGTGLMTYAIAYGINQGLLDKATYLPVVVAAWKGLTNCVDAQGRVGYIQATGSAPAGAAATETHDYGVGAFVLAASEIYNMVK
jgi:rhamnogalacturonyl hydrolase YesR